MQFFIVDFSSFIWKMYNFSRINILKKKIENLYIRFIYIIKRLRRSERHYFLSVMDKTCGGLFIDLPHASLFTCKWNISTWRTILTSIILTIFTFQGYVTSILHYLAFLISKITPSTGCLILLILSCASSLVA